jgi:type IV secretion system protein VirD4
MRSRPIDLLILAMGLLIGLVCATQYVAYGFGYDPRLGFEVGRYGGTVVYWPVAGAYWLTTALYRNGTKLFDQAEALFLACFASAVFLVVLKRPRRFVSEFGKGAWGTLRDARKAGLLSPNRIGVVVGKWRDSRRVLTFSGPEHHLITGASRAGKGVGHVIPTLLSWPHSVLVYDPKEECYDITASFRSKFSYSFYVNFTRQDSACFNPLFEVRKGPTEIADVQNIASILVDPGGVHDTLDFFQTSAKELLTAVILHVLYSRPLPEKNLASVRAAVLSFGETLKAMAKTDHREVSLIANRYLEMEGKVRDSILATASTCLELYADPIVADLTSRSDFTIGDLVCSDAPVSCYLQTPPSDATRLKPLTRLILSQVAQSLMRNLDSDSAGRKKRHKLLYLIDEFPTLGRLGFFTASLRVMAGYGLKAMIIVQSFKDIVEAYGQHNTIVDNCHVIVAFATADNDTARKISDMTGRTVEYRQSQNLHFGSWMRGSRSYQEVQRNVLEPGDVRMLPYDEQLIFVTGSKPLRTSKLRYFEEPYYSSRATDIRGGGRGPTQVNGPYVPQRKIRHDWLTTGT